MASPWITLESNPDVLNKILQELGVDKSWGLMDIFSLDPEDAGFVPQPCLAVILTLPVTEKYLDSIKLVDEGISVTDDASTFNNVYFIKQTIPNSCGTIALIHAIANSMLSLQKDSIIGSFLATTQQLSPEERGKKLEENLEIALLHAAGAQDQLQDPQEGGTSEENACFEEAGDEGGQNQPQEPEEELNYQAAAAEDPFHYIVFVKIEDHVVELDGCKNSPLVHGETTDADFVADVFRVIQTYIDQAPNEKYSALSFGLMDF